MSSPSIYTLPHLPGAKIIIRPIRPEDKVNLTLGLEKLSQTSQYNRFFSYKKEFTKEELVELTEINPSTQVALVMGIERSGESLGIGVARAVKISPQSKKAELAITIIDEYQGMGLGKLLLKELAQAARSLGVEKMCGDLESNNQRILNLLKDCEDLNLKYLGQGILSMEFTLPNHES